MSRGHTPYRIILVRRFNKRLREARLNFSGGALSHIVRKIRLEAKENGIII